jgi:hypothetical protein
VASVTIIVGAQLAHALARVLEQVLAPVRLAVVAHLPILAGEHEQPPQHFHGGAADLRWRDQRPSGFVMGDNRFSTSRVLAPSPLDWRPNFLFRGWSAPA